MAPIIGVAHIGYLPNKRVVGINGSHGSLGFRQAFPDQETMTSQVAQTIQQV